jgi:anti-sigma factor RsiW
MMSDHCQELADKLSGYIDGEIDGEELDTMIKHLEECQCCQKCLETLQATRNMISKMERPEIPPDMKERLKSCLKK